MRSYGLSVQQSSLRNVLVLTYPGVFLWLLQQGRKVLVSLLLLVPSLSPLCDRLPVEDENVEESVEKKDVLWLDGSRIQKHRLTLILVEGVGIKRRLDHNKRIADILMVEHMSIERGLIGRVVEDLQEQLALYIFN